MPTIEPFAWLGTISIGLAAAALGHAGSDSFARAMDAVERDFADKLGRLRALTPRLRLYLHLWLMIVAFAFLGTWLFSGGMMLALPVLAILAAVPWLLLRRMTERRRLKIEDQLADAMATLANAVRAGLSLAQAMEILASQCPKPINSEFHQIAAEYKLGKPLERTLNEAKERLKSENFALFAAALLASHESGGRLNETVERIAQSVLEMQRLDRKVVAETAQARKSAVYMALAPAFILIAYYFIDPVNTTMLFTRLIGQILLATAVILNVVAYVWARMILNPDI